MCGIVGIVSTTPVADRIVDALKRLEYRGYDSAGLATSVDGKIDRRRAPGKLTNLRERLEAEPLQGTIGIGHTRWATHGAPTEENAHPHTTNRVAIVHNGIIENFRELKAELDKDGYKPVSETDTEIVALMVTRELDRGAAPFDAAANVIKRLDGAFALAMMFKGEDNLIVGARQGAPLAIGHGNGEMVLGSDAIAIAPFTDKVTYLEEGDWVAITKDDARIFNREGQPVERAMAKTQLGINVVDKGNHRHFMLKEIYEQPDALSHTVSHYVDLAKGKVKLPADLPFDFAKLNRLTISACGTAYYAGLVAKYWFEKYARLPVEVDVASEFRYREPPMDKDGLALFISQSGETADTLAALRYCKAQGQHIASIVNAQESTIARESDIVFPILCGPEISVASTKATTAQMSVLASLAIAAGRQRGTISEAEEFELVDMLAKLPGAITKALASEKKIDQISHELSKASDVLYLGRGSLFPIALEGALKLKEITYIHAEGYASGELKHGPIALIDETLPVVVVAPSDPLFDKTISNMHEVAARGGKIILITDEAGAKSAGDDVHEIIIVPNAHAFVMPIICAIPVQLLAYYTAVFMGTDVDQPRNLAKSVTVE
ncbi:glutamine--fructose-6-phosphate transaminase (isomerizing) [Maritalea mediterranea]|uniref:Glutamine--fructose-6-phosphate aminotransferase [isomerizing] n=1 Tax=Maritalea mediterranea TaxID=2909667 RepID=A0ABS9E631_9HYPH|nr:glutamine--fructose-6-phosphate transaminase (isomerizing) [Maritalea mediterranea]MCF4098322.1 glutamine--fructose-6-phosphate transaminase (isomerizing) [Maritalea mediterranea]